MLVVLGMHLLGFACAAALLIPALLALGRIRPAEVDPELAHGGLVDDKPDHAPAPIWTIMRKPPLFACEPPCLRAANMPRRLFKLLFLP